MALLDEKDLARQLKISVKTVQAWRFQSRGPAYIKMGSAVRYRPADVEAFLESRTISPKQP